jgi:glc operon protein GlcG
MMQVSGRILFGCLTVLTLIPRFARPTELSVKKALNLEIARQIAAASENEAASHQWHAFVVIVDDGGNVMYLERMDEAQLGSFDVAIAKARSALLFKRPTRMFEDAVHNGYMPVLKVPNAMPVEGGIPLTFDGKIIGAIGVSGGTPQQDGQMAQAGVDAFPSILQNK